ncbi:MAG TPA: hypothetical protein VMZ91_08340 [Candidatus Paceibacterota bacterium]|nr:hypothetical protein [Candidatus Paceibacterota bacterium]
MTDKDTQVYLVEGSYISCQRVLNNVRKSLGEYDEYFFDESVSIEYVISEIKRFSLEDRKRLFVINGWPVGKGKKKADQKQNTMKVMKSFLGDLPSDCTVVLYNLSTSSKTFLSLIGKIGKVYQFIESIPRKKCTNYVTGYLDNNDRQIDPNGLEILINNFNSISGTDDINIDYMAMSLEKLLHIIGNKKTISEQDVRQMMEENCNFVVWSLFNFMDNRNYKGCLKLLRKIQIKETDLTAGLIQILHLFHWRYSMLFFLKESLSTGVSEQETIKSILVISKLKRSGSSFYCFYSESSDKFVSKYNKEAVKIAIKGIYGNKSPLKYYSSIDLFAIIRKIVDTLYYLRYAKTDEIKMSLMESFFSVAARRFSYKIMKNLGRSFDKRVMQFEPSES